MWESIWNSNNIYYVMGIVAVVGVISKVVVHVTLRRLVKAASNMAKSTHKFMKLVRAKYEHACMVNEQVDNVNVFVDKFIHEYEVCGIRLHTWKRWSMSTMWVIFFLTVLAGGTTYYYEGVQEMLFQRCGVGVALMVLMVSIYQVGDEQYKLQAMKLYMVDYLENVCARKYSKNRKAVNQEVVKQEAVNQTEVNQAVHPVEEEGKVVSKSIKKQKRLKMAGTKKAVEVEEKLAATDTIAEVVQSEIAQLDGVEEKTGLSRLQKLLLEEAERREEQRKQKQEEVMPNEAAIREILQEYMV